MTHPYPPPPSWAREISTIGVTGTNGKTTTTALLHAALQAAFAPAGCITTVGTRVGASVTGPVGGHREFLDRMASLHAQGGRHLALEVTSASLGAGFMAGWPVQAGVFTNLSMDHEDQHESPEHYLASKAQLFVHLEAGGSAVLNASDPASLLLREIVPQGVERRTYASPWRGTASEVWGEIDLCLSEPRVGRLGSVAKLSGPLCAQLDVPRLEVQACGLPFLENAAAALLGAVAMGVPPEAARKTIARAAVPPGRFEFLEEPRGTPSNTRPDVVIDYAHTPDALARTLGTAATLAGGEVWLVFGAGGDRSKIKRRPLGEAARTADHVVLTSDNPRREDPLEIIDMVRAGLDGHGDVRVEPDRALAIELALRDAAPGDLVVIAGKGHEREQTVGDRVVPFSDRATAQQYLDRAK